MKARTPVCWCQMVLVLVMLAGAVSGAEARQAEPPASPSGATVTVDGKHPWVDSGLTVQKGERLTFSVEGTLRWGEEPDQVAGPDGHGAKPGKLGAGGLIGRVGYTGKPFPIGSGRTPIAMRKAGKLYLGINDFVFADNEGSFTVTVRRTVH